MAEYQKEQGGQTQDMPDPYPEANIDIVTKKKKKTGFYSLINTVIASMNDMLKTAEFDESKHPRDNAGEFTSKGDGDSSKSQSGSKNTSQEATQKRIDKIKSMLSDMGKGETKKTSRFNKLIKEKQELDKINREYKDQQNKHDTKMTDEKINELVSNPNMVISEGNADDGTPEVTGKYLSYASFETKKTGQRKLVNSDSLYELKQKLDRGDTLKSISYNKANERYTSESEWKHIHGYTTSYKTGPMSSRRNVYIDASDSEIQALKDVQKFVKSATPSKLSEMSRRVSELDQGERGRKQTKHVSDQYDSFKKMTKEDRDEFLDKVRDQYSKTGGGDVGKENNMPKGVVEFLALIRNGTIPKDTDFNDFVSHLGSLYGKINTLKINNMKLQVSTK